MMEIRGKTISYSAFKKKTENILETKITEEIKQLEIFFEIALTKKD